MEKRVRPGILITLLVVLVAGASGGLAAAHGAGDQADEDCEMNHADHECEVTHGEEDCPMMGSGMIDGMTGMDDDCPMEPNGGMMRMDGGASDSHQGC